MQIYRFALVVNSRLNNFDKMHLFDHLRIIGIHLFCQSSRETVFEFKPQKVGCNNLLCM